MKKIFLFILIALFSCKKKQENIISKSIIVNYVSIEKKYGQLCKPPFLITEKIIKNKDYTMKVYIDTVSYKRVDTLKLYYNGKIFFNNIKVDKVDEKVIINKKKVIYTQKIYVPHSGKISVDNYSGEIIYITNDGILARYSTTSKYISLYKPNLYSDLHNNILYRKVNFKRHPNELEGLP